MLPQILGGEDPPEADPSLLLVGNVQFNATPANRSIQDAILLIADVNRNPLQTLSLLPGLSSANPSAHRGNLGQWADLPGTLAEVEAIHHTFGQEFPAGVVTELRGPWPTGDALSAQAPRYRYLHLATHGYFAPPMLRSALTTTSRSEQFVRHDVTGFHPGLLSGLVLAGANRSASLGQDHGILTALEVAELDLRNTDLVVLSACETGLGEIAGGEGLLGLQRAFQTAGARTTVASLWSVDDAATQQLMVHFYDNLWKKKLPKLEAMRQAQLAMLQGRGGSSIGRGLDLLEPDPGETGSARISPRLWAAWVLSGDPGIVRPMDQFEPTVASVKPESSSSVARWLILAVPVTVVIGLLVLVVRRQRPT
jgi:CHAT domain-containing protein